MKASSTCLSIIALTAILVVIVNYSRGAFSTPPPNHAVVMAGQAIGFNLIPLFVGGVSFLVRRRVTVFFIGWLIAFVIFGQAAVFQAFRDASQNAKSPSSIWSRPRQQTHTFSASFAPWEVSFVGDPAISKLNHGISGHPAIQAEIEYPDGSMCRAEIYSMPIEPPYDATRIDSMLRQVAARDGLSDLVLISEYTVLGPKHSMRSGKILEGSAITFFTQIFVADSSFIAMTVGAPASSYPTPEIVHFLDSVTKREIRAR